MDSDNDVYRHAYRDPEVARAVFRSVADQLEVALNKADIVANGGQWWVDRGLTHTDEWTESHAFVVLRERIEDLVTKFRNERG